MREFGGFEHNLQSLRVVDELEERYAEFPGLNLTFETREGILKHCSLANARRLGDVGERFLERRQPGLEAQLANLADDIAYNNHDVDDGLRAGLITIEELRELQLFGRQYEQVHRALSGELQGRRLVHEVVRRMIDYVVDDLIDESSRRTRRRSHRPMSRPCAPCPPLLSFSEQRVRRAPSSSSSSCGSTLYRHDKVQRMTHQGAGACP